MQCILSLPASLSLHTSDEVHLQVQFQQVLHAILNLRLSPIFFLICFSCQLVNTLIYA